MENETQIGNLVIDLQIKTNALEKGLETAKKKIQEMEQQNENLQNSNSQLDASFVAMSAGIIASLAKITSAIKDCIDEYNAYTQAMSSLSNVADYTGEDLADLGKIMDKFSSYMTQSDLATTIKNFSLMGMTAEETEKMIEALTNSAIRNRNANYTVSEAVRVASEGYRQGLSTLSDSAGVTENLSVMLDNYAQSIGKTASQLTEAEKNQAYLNRTMLAAEPFAGAMEDYLDTLAGKQGEYSQSVRETQVAYTEAMESTLAKFEEFKTNIMTGLGDIISSNESATVGITTFVVTLGTLALGLKAAKKAYDIYQASAIKATIATEGLTAVMKNNVFGILAIAISGVIAVSEAHKKITEEQAQAQEVLNKNTEIYNSILSKQRGYTSDEISEAKERVEDIKEEINLINEISKKRLEVSTIGLPTSESAKEAKKDLEELEDQYKELSGEVLGTGEDMKQSLKDLNVELNKSMKYLNQAEAIENISKAFDTDTIQQQQKEAAQLKINANELKNYLNIIKKADKTSTEYQNAVQQVAKAYPEASSAGGILTDVLQGIVDAQQLQADEAWSASQQTIQSHIKNIETALNDENVQRKVAENMGIAYDEKFKPKLQAILLLLKAIGGYEPDEVPNITPTTYTPKTSSSSKTYSNKKLDNYKNLIEYKKSLDQISLKEEISMYETALKKYAKTTDEKRELRTKIYELNKEMAQKEKDLLDQQTEDYEAAMQKQKNAQGAAYDIKDQEKDYDKIIKMHKKYLKEIMKDERLSLEERKEIYREELETIRDYEQQKRDLRVEQIDNTVTQLTNAITKQLEEMQEKDTEMINKNIEQVEKWKDARINAINEEYDARIEAINKELDALDKAEEQKTRDEEDAEYERKKQRLEELVAYEHDATTKANYQKELDKLVAEYQKTLDERALADKKELLNAQKESLEQEQDNKIAEIENQADATKEQYEKQLESIEDYYSNQIDSAQKTAEKMLLNTEENQKEILKLLKNYGDEYEITGQSLGEKLAQGINSGVANNIENVIKKIQTTIDSNIEKKMSEIISSSYTYKAGSDKPSTTTINISQTNNIEQNPELPSETYRKLNNVSQSLAAEIAGI